MCVCVSATYRHSLTAVQAGDGCLRLLVGAELDERAACNNTTYISPLDATAHSSLCGEHYTLARLESVPVKPW